MDIQGLNRTAWDKAVEAGENPYTRWYRVSKLPMRGRILGHPSKSASDGPARVVAFAPGTRVLCLAAGGGQQAPNLGRGPMRR
jgi:hypothetical protein